MFAEFVIIIGAFGYAGFLYFGIVIIEFFDAKLRSKKVNKRVKKEQFSY